MNQTGLPSKVIIVAQPLAYDHHMRHSQNVQNWSATNDQTSDAVPAVAATTETQNGVARRRGAHRGRVDVGELLLSEAARRGATPNLTDAVTAAVKKHPEERRAVLERLADAGAAASPVVLSSPILAEFPDLLARLTPR